MRGLTNRQLEVLQFIEGYIARVGWPPSLRDIKRHFGFVSNMAPVDHLRALEAKGFVAVEPKTARGIRVLKSTEQGHPVANV